MITYNDKTQGVIESNGHFVLPTFAACDEAVFKASFIVAADMECEGKVSALFDLIVFGNLKASELDVKGKFVCTGKVEVSGSIVVQNDIWANDIKAESIESHDKIVVQDIEGGTIVADGSIVVGKILAVEKLAKSYKNILCGETAYGSGKIAANTVITGEELDLDNGEDAVFSPNTYIPISGQFQYTLNATAGESSINLIALGKADYAPRGNYSEYLDLLTMSVLDSDSKAKFSHWASVLFQAETVIQSGMSEYTNVAELIWLAEIADSIYFKDWDKVKNIFEIIKNHFTSLVKKNKSSVGCIITSYTEWLEALTSLNRHGYLLDSATYSVAFELIVSDIGLKAKFVSERLNEKGWKAHAE